MLMMIDAFQPEGVTHLAVDSIFMMPQLGVLAQVNEAAATQVFERDCLIHLGTCIAPVGVTSSGDVGVTITGDLTETVPFGELRLYPLGVGEKARVTIQPQRRLDMGAGQGQPVGAEVEGGVVGLVVDTRGRPLEVSTASTERVAPAQEMV